MNYNEAIEYLYNSRPPFHQVGAAAYKPGLENTLRLMAHVGNPHEVRMWRARTERVPPAI